MNVDELFAGQARAERLSAGMTQEQVVARMKELGHFNFHQATIYKIEAGQRKVTVGEAHAIAQVLGVPLDSLLPAEDERPVAQNRERLAQQLQMNQRLIERAIELYEPASTNG